MERLSLSPLNLRILVWDREGGGHGQQVSALPAGGVPGELLKLPMLRDDLQDGAESPEA